MSTHHSPGDYDDYLYKQKNQLHLPTDSPSNDERPPLVKDLTSLDRILQTASISLKAKKPNFKALRKYNSIENYADVDIRRTPKPSRQGNRRSMHVERNRNFRISTKSVIVESDTGDVRDSSLSRAKKFLPEISPGRNSALAQTQDKNSMGMRDLGHVLRKNKNDHSIRRNANN